MTSPQQITAQHAVIAIGSELMELRDNADGTVIAKAERASGTWTIKITRDPSFTDTKTVRADAWMSMITNGPIGVNATPPTVGYSTQLMAPVESLAASEA